jgi:hypothetical protein
MSGYLRQERYINNTPIRFVPSALSLNETKEAHRNVFDMVYLFFNSGWLNQSRTGCYSLSIRSKLELKSYIEENYNEEDRPPQCAACREIVMRVESQCFPISIYQSQSRLIFINFFFSCCAVPVCKPDFLSPLVSQQTRASNVQIQNVPKQCMWRV